MEEFKLVDPTITMLVATNEAHFEDFIAAKDKKGGFMGRTFVIAETEVHRLNPLIDPLDVEIDRDKLIPHLKEIADLKGPFKTLSKTDAGELYKAWYTPFYEVVKQQGIKDETGTINRFGDSVLKVAMLLSLAEDTSMEISFLQMEEAIKICERLIGNIRRTTMGKTGNDASNTTRKTILINELMQRDSHSISRQMLNKKYWMQGNMVEWDECALSLEAGGILKIDSHANVIAYTMPPEVFEQMDRFMKGKSK